MRVRRLGLAGVTLFVPAACGLQSLDEPQPGERRVAADPRAVAAGDAAIADVSAPDAVEEAAADSAPDAGADVDAGIVDAALVVDSSTTADTGSPPVCAGPSCYNDKWLTSWALIGEVCAAKYVSCAWACGLADGGAACIEPPAECALGAQPLAGAACPVLAAGLCFEDGADACACACAGKSCTLAVQSYPKIPKLKLPPTPTLPPPDGSTPEATAAAGDAGSESDGGGDDAAPASDAAADGQSSSDAGSGQLIAVCGP